MGSNKKSYYTQRNAEMRARWEAGESVHEIMLFSDLKMQRTCQILGIQYQTTHENNGNKSAPKKSTPGVSSPALIPWGEWWVTCERCCDSRLYRRYPRQCQVCAAPEQKLVIEKVDGDVFWSRHLLRLRVRRLQALYEFITERP